MKWAFVFVFICILFSNNIHSQSYANQGIPFDDQFDDQTATQIINHVYFFPAFFKLNLKEGTSSYLNYDAIVDLVTVILLVIIAFFVVVTPLILILSWSYFSQIYVKKYRKIFSIKKWLLEKKQLNEKYIQKDIWWSYRKVYSSMIGFGISIIAYAFFSIRFMTSNFTTMEFAITEYFSFPFRVLENLKWTESNQISIIHLDDLWDEMFLVVIMSFVFFLIGVLIGSMLVDLRLKLIEKKVEAFAKKAKMKKEMFYIKINEKIEVKSQMKTEQVS